MRAKYRKGSPLLLPEVFFPLRGLLRLCYIDNNPYVLDMTEWTQKFLVVVAAALLSSCQITVSGVLIST